jgi:hypothetical protein
LVALLSALIALAQASSASPAPGMQFDLVVKLQALDPAQYTPQVFDKDFEVASDPKNAPLGLMGSQSTLATTGVAERHYLSASKERVDNLTYRESEILDCGAGTVTQLDMVAKTFSVQALSASGVASSPGPVPMEPVPAYDRTSPYNPKLSYHSDTKALGTRRFGEIVTDGYQIDETFSFEIPHMNVQVRKMAAVRFFTRDVVPAVTCGASLRARVLMGVAEVSPQYSGLSMLDSINRDAIAQKDPDIENSISGVTLPLNRLALLEVASTKTQMDAYTMLMYSTVERGHFKSIPDDAPVFSVPTDFRKVTYTDQLNERLRRLEKLPP